MEKATWNWRRIGKWAFWITNIVGIIIAIPVLSAVWPLIKVYWDTRSEAVVLANETYQTNQSITLPTPEPEPSGPPPATVESAVEPVEQAPVPPELATIETELEKVPDISRTSIDEIIAVHFGKAAPSVTADPETFDEDTAVFENIDKVIREIDGTRYHIYVLYLRDINENRTTRVAAFEKPNAEYERSLQTMKLVQSNSQLKSIYDAFSHVLAEMANDQESVAEDEENIEVDLNPEQIERVLK